jgi:conjugal transfer pilus assembly protein TraW
MCCSDHKPRHAMSMRQRLTTIIATTLLAFNIGAQDLGVIGPVYPIAEPSLLEVILTKLRHAESTGVLGQLQRDAQTRIRRGIEQPESITNVSKTTKPRTHYYDPSLVIPYAISDAEGRIIIAPGTTVNPLDTVSLSKHLLFFDARDADQVKRARALLDQHHGKVKLILTGGSYLDLMKHWKQPVFFDQQGLLTTKLRIQQVPALVYQDGKRLRIDEIL